MTASRNALHEFHTISKRVTKLEASETGNGLAVADFQTQSLDESAGTREIIDFEAEMGLRASPIDAIFGTYVNLNVSELEPETTSR